MNPEEFLVLVNLCYNWLDFLQPSLSWRDEGKSRDTCLLDKVRHVNDGEPDTDFILNEKERKLEGIIKEKQNMCLISGIGKQ